VQERRRLVGDLELSLELFSSGANSRQTRNWSAIDASRWFSDEYRRRWRLSFAVLFNRMTRRRDGLLEHLTRGLTRQQADERKHRLVGLPVVMRPVTCKTGDTARSRSPSSRRPAP
jgi:hypothetical protein